MVEGFVKGMMAFVLFIYLLYILKKGEKCLFFIIELARISNPVHMYPDIQWKI